MSVWLLPPNPGPFGTLQQWTAWRDVLRALDQETAGVDAELEVAEHAILGMIEENQARLTG
jgi:hypothetical protein